MTAFSIDPHRLEELLTYCVSFAKQMLEASGEFYPFGAVIRADGVFSGVGFDAGEEHPKAQDVFLGLHSGFKGQFEKGEILAAAIAVNANIPSEYQPEFLDGIRVAVECRGYSRFFYVPYRISKPSGLGALVGRKSKIEYRDFIPVDVPASMTI